jgi:hypothetical protein
MYAVGIIPGNIIVAYGIRVYARGISIQDTVFISGYDVVYDNIL